MKLKAIILFAALIPALILAGCNAVDTKVNSQAHANNNSSTTPQPPQANDNVKRITSAELAALMEQGKVVVVDVRNQQMYDHGHIRGAKLIPVTEIGNRANELPKDKQIVTYCS